MAELILQLSLLKHLQQQVEHVRVRLLDLVEQNHAVGPAPDPFGEHAALLVADVSGRCAYQAGDVVLLHEVRHVDAHQGIFIAEQKLGQGLGRQRLADSGGPQEHERSERAPR